MNEHYDLLKVDDSVTIADIKKSFRTLSKTYHPDSGGSNEKFIKLNTSFMWLLKNHVQKPKVVRETTLKRNVEIIEREATFSYMITDFSIEVKIPVPMRVADDEYVVIVKQKEDIHTKGGQIISFVINKGDVMPKVYTFYRNDIYYNVYCNHRIG